MWKLYLCVGRVNTLELLYYTTTTTDNVHRELCPYTFYNNMCIGNNNNNPALCYFSYSRMQRPLRMSNSIEIITNDVL